MAEKRIIVKYRRQQRKSEKRPLENINSFLYKLWSMVNDEKLPLIHWSPDGERLVIEDREKFTDTVLDCGEKQPFKTKNIASFIRQLNLYGFRRVKENCGKVPLIFEHEYFIQGRPDLLVEVKRNRPVPMNKPIPQAVVLSPPNCAKPVLQQNQIPGIPGYVPYPRLPTTQPYTYFKNPTGAKNVPMSLVTPFPVNHAPTFINLGSHSAMLGKPRVSKEVESNGVHKPDKKELYNLKAASESSYNPWQHAAYYTTALQDRKIPRPYNNSMQALLQIQGNRQTYPSPYFNGNMYGIPHLGYRNYGDASENMAYQNHHLPSQPYFPFSPFSSPPIPQPVSVPTSPTLTSSESSAKLATVKAEKGTSSPGMHFQPLESFDIFTSKVPKASVNEAAVAKLTADEEEKECNPEEKDVKE